MKVKFMCSPARVEFLFYRINPSQRRNSPGRNFEIVQAGLCWQVIKSNADGVELLQCVH